MKTYGLIKASSKAVNIRKAASVESEIIGRLNKEDILFVVFDKVLDKNNWRQISAINFNKNLSGWICKDFVEILVLAEESFSEGATVDLLKFPDTELTRREIEVIKKIVETVSSYIKSDDKAFEDFDNEKVIKFLELFVHRLDVAKNRV